MRKIAYKLEIGFCGCSDEGEIEISDDMTIEEIDNIVNEMAMEHAQSWEGDERLFDDWEAEGTYDAFYENVYGSWEFVHS